MSSVYTDGLPRRKPIIDSNVRKMHRLQVIAQVICYAALAFANVQCEQILRAHGHCVDVNISPLGNETSCSHWVGSGIKENLRFHLRGIHPVSMQL